MKIPLLFFLIFLNSNAGEGTYHKVSENFNLVKNDYANFYGINNSLYLAGGLAFAGLLAHTANDRVFDNWYQDNLSSPVIDSYAKIFKFFGEGNVIIPIFTMSFIGNIWIIQGQEKSFLSNWISTSFRAYLVGAPAVLLWQRILGASRPRENNGSEWHFLSDDNGVSGHGFVGAVPWLTASNYVQSKWFKSILIIASAGTSWSRINDEKHYLSQALLGWWYAYNAVKSVNISSQRKDHVFLNMENNNILTGFSF